MASAMSMPVLRRVRTLRPGTLWVRITAPSRTTDDRVPGTVPPGLPDGDRPSQQNLLPPRLKPDCIQTLPTHLIFDEIPDSPNRQWSAMCGCGERVGRGISTNARI